MAKTKQKLKRGTPEHREWMRTIGLIGGKRTKARMLAKNPNYYQEIGLRGAEELMRRHGVEHFRRAAMIREDKKREAQS